MSQHIPDDLAAWDPRDVQEWLDRVLDDEEVTEAAKHDAARAVTAALLDDYPAIGSREQQQEETERQQRDQRYRSTEQQQELTRDGQERTL
ncbi:hypothetical protein [Streptomyces sp. BRA346]|uniref:hypothetical protein n=1 Tax=Streptomyces sp. BRA346 TaxID=2878199 RepID=UPI004064512E